MRNGTHFVPRVTCSVGNFLCANIWSAWPDSCIHWLSSLSPLLERSLANVRPPLFEIETWSGNHMFIFSYLRRGLRMPRAVYWVLRMSHEFIWCYDWIKCTCTEWQKLDKEEDDGSENYVYTMASVSKAALKGNFACVAMFDHSWLSQVNKQSKKDNACVQ